MNRRALIPLLFVFAFAAACGDDEPNTETWLVEDYLVPCTGVGSQLCNSYETGGERNLLYGSVEGFEWDWGRDAEIVVRLEDVAEPEADGSSIRYNLDEVVSTTPVSPGDTFEWVLFSLPPGDTPFLTVDGEQGTLMDGRAFQCATPDVCASLGSELMPDETIRVTFEYGADTDGVLTVVSALPE